MVCVVSVVAVVSEVLGGVSGVGCLSGLGGLGWSQSRWSRVSSPVFVVSVVMETIFKKTASNIE